ncbi:MAG: hypothetical protein CMJ18_14505, partial [Phycisphaeraceae bacterium]|nr:hypothetical protein [Phycisphaeraceae bacterium]
MAWPMMTKNHRAAMATCTLAAVFVTAARGAPQEVTVGNTSLRVARSGMATVSHAGRPVARGFFARFTDGKDGALARSSFPGREEPRFAQRLRGDGINVVATLDDARLGRDTRTIIFEVRSHSVRIRYDLSLLEKEAGTAQAGFLLLEQACAGARFTATLDHGQQKRGALGSDPLYPDPALERVRRLELSPEQRAALDVEATGLAPFRFEDRRREAAYGRARRVVAAGAGSRLEGGFTLSFGGGPDAVFSTVDMRAACNMGLADGIPNDGAGGWTDDGRENDLRDLPTGRAFFGGIPFDVINPDKNRGRATAVLKGGPKHGGSFPERIEIPLRRRGAALHVLHAAAWVSNRSDSGRTIGAYVLRYADGVEEAHELVCGRDILNWWGTEGAPNFLAAWEGSNRMARVRLGLSSFPVGRPQVPVDTIRIEKRGATESMLGVVAMTLSDIPLRIQSGKAPAGPVAMPPLRYRFAGQGALVARWLSPDKEKKFPAGASAAHRVTGITAVEGYGVTAGKDDVLVMGVRGKYDSSMVPSPSDTARIARFVSEGGALLVAWPLDGSVDGLAHILPVRKKAGAEPVVFVPKRDILTVEPLDHDHPVFSGIDWEDYLPQPYTYPVTPRKDAQVLARFSNGEPALVHGHFGKGRVLYCAAPFDFGWYVGGITMRRYPWPRTTYYLRLLYWLKGNEAYAAFLGKLPRIQRLREKLTDSLTGCVFALQNARALATYVGHEEPMRLLENRADGISDEMDAADRLHVRLDLAEANRSYRSALKRSRELAADVEAAARELTRQAKGQEELEAVPVRSGPPLRIGSHGVGIAYCTERSSDCGVRERAIRRLLERQSKLGFNTVAEHVALAYFVKPGADPTRVDEGDLNLWVYDDLLRVCRSLGFKCFIGIDSEDGYGWTGGDFDYFHRGNPVLEPRKKRYGSRPTYRANIYNETFLKRRSEVLEKVAARFAEDPGVLGYDLDNEPGLWIHYGDDAVAHFRAWLEAKYGGIEAANRALGTRVETFDEIVPPRAEDLRGQGLADTAPRAAWYEWRTFVDEVVVRHYRTDYETIKRASPDKIVRERFAEMTVAGNEKPHYRRGRQPYERITRNLDMTGVHTWRLYPLDLARTQAGRAEVGMSEYYPLALDGPYDFALRLHEGIGGQWAVPRVESEKINFAAAQRNFWVAASRGVRVFSIHAPGAGTGVYHMALPSGVHWRRAMYALKHAGADFARVRGELDGARAISQVALLEAPASVIQAVGSPIEEDVTYAGAEQKAVFYALHDPLGIQSDPVGPEADLGRYPLVIASQP